MSFSHNNQRAYHRLHAALEESVRPSSRYLSEDARASKIARALRGRDLDTVEICLEAEGLMRHPVVRLGLNYARAFERAYPNSRIGTSPCADEAAAGKAPQPRPAAADQITEGQAA